MKTLTLEAAMKAASGIKADMEKALPRLLGGTYQIRTAVAFEGGGEDDDPIINKATDGQGAYTVHVTAKIVGGDYMNFQVLLGIASPYERGKYVGDGVTLTYETDFQRQSGQCFMVKHFVC